MNKLTVYLTHWCSDCRRARRFLKEHNVPFKEIDVDESPDAEELVMQVNNGRRKVPTFELEGRFFSSSPFNSSQLAEDLASLLKK
jgi:glutaredoxin